MAVARFQQGDRVRSHVSTPFVQAGTLGTVALAFPPIADGYEVYFDGYSHVWLMWADELELVDVPTGQTKSPDR